MTRKHRCGLLFVELNHGRFQHTSDCGIVHIHVDSDAQVRLAHLVADVRAYAELVQILHAEDTEERVREQRDVRGMTDGQLLAESSVVGES